MTWYTLSYYITVHHIMLCIISTLIHIHIYIYIYIHVNHNKKEEDDEDILFEPTILDGGIEEGSDEDLVFEDYNITNYTFKQPLSLNTTLNCHPSGKVFFKIQRFLWTYSWWWNYRGRGAAVWTSCACVSHIFRLYGYITIVYYL